MERIRFLTHQGQRILFIDCVECPSNEIGEIADHVPDYVKKEPDKSVLLLADFTGSQLTRDSVERIKVAAVHNQRHLKRSAWVMPENLPKPLHEAVQKFSTRSIPLFKTRDEALDYLTRDELSSPLATAG
jgi:hypothetical protein